MADNYGKIYQGLWDSSLMDHPEEIAETVGWLFVTVVVHSDKDGYIRKSDSAIKRLSRISSQKRFDEAIEILLSPDPNSNINKHNGRRLLRLRDLPNEDENRGYLVVNKDHYRDKQSSTTRVKQLRRRSEIYMILSQLLFEQNNETFQERWKPIVYVYASVSVSDDIINYIVVNNIDLEVWAAYEKYRKEVLKKPMYDDTMRKKQLNVLKGNVIEDQRRIVTETRENGWTKLVPIEDIKNAKPNTSKRPMLEATSNAFKTFIEE